MTNLQDNDNILQYQYDANSNLTLVFDTKLDGVDMRITYNKANLPISYRTSVGSSNRQHHMSYYLDGNKYQETDSSGSIVKTYEYDTLGQLENENETKNSSSVYSASYTYNPYGNRSKMTYTSSGTTEVTNYTYDANNRLTQSECSVGNDITGMTRYYYDRNDNTTAEQKTVYTDGGSIKSNMNLSGHSGGSMMKLYRYDEFNRLIKYNDDGAEAEYTYNVNNLRASKKVNGAVTDYVWNGQNLVSETKNDVTTVHAYDPTGVISSRTGTDTAIKYVKDPHGNVVTTIKNNQSFGTYDYTAFGNRLESTDSTTPFRYCGEYYDEESGLTYLRNRYYDSETGRFINEDPIRDGLNWYIYGGNNPVIMIDPSGLNNEEMSPIANMYLQVAKRKLNIMSTEATSDEEREWISIMQSHIGDYVATLDNQDKEKMSIMYEVQMFLQNDIPGCWAYCQVSYENWRYKKNMTPAEADVRAKELLRQELGDEINWNKGGVPTNAYYDKRSNIRDTRYPNNGADIKAYLENGPVYAGYIRGVGNNISGHMVLITGTVQWGDLPTLIQVKNPQGSESILTYDEFLTGFNYINNGYKLENIYMPH